MCLICPNSTYTPLSKAVQHEDNKSHVARVRTLDRTPAAMSSPLHATSDSESEASESGRNSRPCSSRSRSHSPFSLLDEEFDLFGDRPSVHGPALPADDPNQIYDDFSGELARNRPSPKSFDDSDSSDDENCFGDFQGPQSDGTIPGTGLVYMDMHKDNKSSKIIRATITAPRAM